MFNATRKNKAALYTGIVLILLWALLPYLWMFRATFLTPVAALQKSTPLIPFFSKAFNVRAYTQVWNNYALPLYFKNSLIIAFSATIISTVVSVPGAYAFARLNFPGRKYLFYGAVITVMFPWIVLTIPVYDIFFTLGLIDKLVGVIIALSIFVMPQTIWLLQGFFREGIPENLEEAAMLDGNSELTAFLRVVLPLSLPAVAAAAMFAFLGSWNNFLWVFILTSEKGDWTIPVAIHHIVASDIMKPWNLVMAAVTFLVIPPVILYGISQRYVGEGLSGAR